MNKFITSVTEKHLRLESTDKHRIKYYLYGVILRAYKRYEGKRVSQKWFWFWGRFHLPPYWWRTKTFKILTTCMILVTLCVVSWYIISNRSAEDIVNSIDTSVMPKADESKGVEESTDELKMISGSLYIDEDTQEYNFLRYDLSDAIAKNSDTVGWLNIGYCGISYPIVQGTDNDFYLHHDFNKTYNTHGWVFRDFRYNEDTHENIVLYGHNLMAGGMFSSLSNILDSKDPVYVQYQTRGSTYIYEVISVYTTEPVLSYIQMNFKSTEELRKFKKDIVNSNQWKYAPKVKLTDDDSILTLSTCYGDDRLAVHCRLIASEVL